MKLSKTLVNRLTDMVDNTTEFEDFKIEWPANSSFSISKTKDVTITFSSGNPIIHAKRFFLNFVGTIQKIVLQEDKMNIVIKGLPDVTVNYVE